nr:fibroblast growth factor 1 isoform X2 [Desmodus rotundus]
MPPPVPSPHRASVTEREGGSRLEAAREALQHSDSDKHSRGRQAHSLSPRRETGTALSLQALSSPRPGSQALSSVLSEYGLLLEQRRPGLGGGHAVCQQTTADCGDCNHRKGNRGWRGGATTASSREKPLTSNR